MFSMLKFRTMVYDAEKTGVSRRQMDNHFAQAFRDA